MAKYNRTTIAPETKSRVKSGLKKFYSPEQLRKRFNLTKVEYQDMLKHGLPIVICAGVTRHPIDDFYLWCEKNDYEPLDTDRVCMAKTLQQILGISHAVRISWEKMGLPKKFKIINGKPSMIYDVKEVENWLKNQTKINMGV